jgi:cobalt-zinc-cadmium resistance protein CzcA
VHRAFVPLLGKAMRHRLVTLVATLALLGGTFFVAGDLGAEFVPQLDEGDLLIEARRLTGISLSESVRTSLRLETALRKIPEIDHVVSRTGAPEVATDPMGVEQSDVYLSLKPRREWRRGVTKSDIAKEVAARMEAEVPEIGGAVSQPIQMRTNELIAGVRSDVAVIIYGRDLDELTKLGERTAALLRGIDGVYCIKK